MKINGVEYQRQKLEAHSRRCMVKAAWEREHGVMDSPIRAALTAHFFTQAADLYRTLAAGMAEREGK